jgi:peptidoglycan/LPS O-acetylase OafA/YrhL
MHALDGLRGLAALGVMLLHVWLYTGANAPDKSPTVDRWMGELRLTILLFFVLSGFLLAAPWIAAARGEREAPKLGRYIARRAARIVPAYWLALAGAVLLLHGTGHGRDVPLQDLPKFIFFLPNVFPETRNQLDPPMWSLHVEVSFYVVLPLIGLALMRAGHGRRGLLAVCGVLIAAGVAWTTAGTLGNWTPEITWTLPTYLATFMCGVVAAVLAYEAKPRRWVAHAAFALGAAAVLGDAVWHMQGYSPVLHSLRDLPASIGFAAMIWSVALRPAPVLGSLPLRPLGTLSYGIYLWHYLVIYWLQMHHWFPQGFGAAVLYVLPLTFMLATGSWFLVERPVLRLSARALRRRREPRRPQAAMAES